MGERSIWWRPAPPLGARPPHNLRIADKNCRPERARTNLVDRAREGRPRRSLAIPSPQAASAETVPNNQRDLTCPFFSGIDAGGEDMKILAQERKLYDQLRIALEAQARGQWALIRRNELIGTFASFELAAKEADRRFGRGPYLIREIGAPNVSPPSVPP